MEKQWGYPNVYIQWSVMQEILASLVPRDRVHGSHSFKSYEELPGEGSEGGGVAIRFAERAEPVVASLLVGADGAFSAVRKQLGCRGADKTGVPFTALNLHLLFGKRPAETVGSPLETYRYFR